MDYGKKEILLKDHTPCILRSPRTEDAQEMIRYFTAVAGESHFMTNYPEEIELTTEEETEFLKKKLESPTDAMIAAWIGDEIIGNASIYVFADQIKMRHRACFGIAIKEKFQGRGLGSVLTREAVTLAEKNGFSQIELGVFADNDKALSLYRKYGFEEWGRTRNAFRLKDGSYRDEIVMGLLL